MITRGFFPPFQVSHGAPGLSVREPIKRRKLKSMIPIHFALDRFIWTYLLVAY
jgi:hypothetical protein